MARAARPDLDAMAVNASSMTNAVPAAPDASICQLRALVGTGFVLHAFCAGTYLFLAGYVLARGAQPAPQDDRG